MVINQILTLLSVIVGFHYVWGMVFVCAVFRGCGRWLGYLPAYQVSGLTVSFFLPLWSF